MSSNRRKFLKDSAKILTLAGLSNTMANAVVQSIAKSAFASSATSMGSNKKYIYLSLDGAPPRWFFDIPLTPNGTSDHYPSNNIIGNYIAKDGANVSVINRPWKDPYSGLHLPPVWGSNPTTSDGRFTNLANSLYFFRGVDMEIDNHEVTRLRNQAPTIGGLSIAGMFAPETNNPLPAVVSGSIGDSFKAERIVSPITVTHSNVAATNNSIVTAMNYVSGAKPIVDAHMRQQLRYFDDYAKANGFAKYGVKEAKDKADAMIVEGVTKFTSQWTTVYNKYNALIKEALTNSKNRDKFVAAQTIRNPSLDNPGDKRMSFTATGGVSANSTITNLQSSLQSNSTIPQLAAIFACLEILIANNITSICIFSLSGNLLTGVHRTDSGTTFNLPADQHFIGTLLSTYTTSHFYRGLAICLDELAFSLNAAGVWRDTLIQFGSEFGRYPREDMSGADHQTSAGSALLISGSFNETRVVGNLIQTKNAGYNGFTGRGTGIKNLDGDQLRVNDVVKTVSHFFDVRPVTENGQSLLLLKQSQLEKKNVA
ncbi:hypothetical protein BDW_09930 [Bdellovibrio bacteriovorus W]|nr:hypothetical protein BDW_09930 [Bdellovibrio bacteriovorus W]